jgi:hypothetical protein
VADNGPDMRPEAVTARLREIGRLLNEQGPRPKGVDMSVAAVTARLRSLGTLADACRRLGRARL